MTDAMKSEREPSEPVGTFERDAGRPQIGFLGEFLHFLLTNKKWWLTPIILVLLLVGIVVMLGSTAAAPFIYTLF